MRTHLPAGRTRFPSGPQALSRRAFVSAVATAFLLAAPLAAQPEAGRYEAEEDPDEAVYWAAPAVLPGAQEVLAGVRAALPREPLRMEALLKSRDRGGRNERVLHADMLLQWGADPPSARYTIRDAFGAPLEELVVRHGPASSSSPASYRYAAGDPPVQGRVPDLYAPIQETDISWADLTLSFLWWPGGETVDVEKIKGRYCYVVELPVPESEQGPVHTVKLWVDGRFYLLLQAEAKDRQGRPLRRLQVKSLKKVNDRWVVKDLEVRSQPSAHRTLLRVESVDPVAAPAAKSQTGIGMASGPAPSELP